MITPRFSLTQNDETVTITIRAPYCSLKELDVSVEDSEFIFSCRPYYLRLNLPGKIEENDKTNSKFDSDSGEFTFTYEKVVFGEHFEDLQFITKLLGKKIEIESGGRLIEVIGSQTVPETEVDDDMKYGFAMRGGYRFNIISGEFGDVFDIDPHEVKFQDRTSLRHKNEQKDFNSEHYLADLFDNDELSELLTLKVPWEDCSVEFTSKELDFLKDLPNVEYNLSAQQIQFCHNSLLDILYSYCYDCRSTCFDSTCESGWTISKLSASLCCFDSFATPKEAVICAFRRSLIYPLYRNFNFCQKVLSDLKVLISRGDQYIIKCLIDIYNIFLKGDSGRFILNNLFIKDYIVYIMKWDKELWCKTVTVLNSVTIQKQELGLNLVQLEKAVEEDDLTSTLANLSLNHCDSDDSVTDTDTSDSCDDD
ncbi:protein SHQ1 homolog [Photinus pyralis]|uniref:protein SHQ1 homolog n=1 Tax=Photinus pyralis TaxID=7054 RepID=UPI00126728A6|nr:protein SHQ1 homolog [Photinus pyralis]